MSLGQDKILNKNPASTDSAEPLSAHNEAMATVGLVCAHYQKKNLLRTARALDRINSSIHMVHSVLVSNDEESWVGLNAEIAGRSQSCEIIRHDNSGLEFGAYQAGIDRLVAGFDPDWILIANDTFATHSNFSTVYRDKLVDELAHVRDFPAIIGQVESLSRSYELAGLRTHRWITTHLFAINRDALRALGGRIYWPELETLVTDTSDMSAFFSPAVDPVLRDHLEVWLFSTRPGPHWYASEPLRPVNVAKMARKARSILQEKNLAAVLDGSAAEFVDLKRLSILKKILRKIDDKVFELTRKE